MITAEQVNRALDETISGTDIFVVQVKVHPGNRIEVDLDADEGLTIERCREVHKKVEALFDRETEDYSLTIGSPGLDEPLRVVRQYRKNTGRILAVTTRDGRKLEGMLKQADDLGIMLEIKVKTKGKPASKWPLQEEQLPFEAIAEAKIVIQFK
ncbi:MAG TPA: ribosome assembly cofactor RimP [Cytophagales bacterium]|nr:ribosome assembly cofactor RimP [Cytophagales bacterium]